MRTEIGKECGGSAVTFYRVSCRQAGNPFNQEIRETEKRLWPYCQPIGGITWKQEIVFNLPGEDAVITETHIGQDLNPNIAPPPQGE